MSETEEIIRENDSHNKLTSWQPWLRVASPLNGKYLVETTRSARRCSKKPLFSSYARHYSTTRFCVPFVDESTNGERQLSWKTSAKRIRAFSFWDVFIDTSACSRTRSLFLLFGNRTRRTESIVHVYRLFWRCEDYSVLDDFFFESREVTTPLF